MEQDAAPPGGDWAHSFEEDQGDLRVYRPVASFVFPPARRGRAHLSFDADGQMTQQLPGPDDRLELVSCSPLGMNRFRMAGGAGQTACTLELVEAAADKLVLRLLPSD
ncbi:hypothetical protein [Paucibacter sp. XJ19-41]|uniref:hypothetical protein n=1 Tax=Paucibacter sp. XJ19-41 TaxID=2927824 RepID=UPI002349474E|nr:hypothetical protein [Paucibacter sp. XJ19-41]MDC6171082.1 hypothetical protein [Paucibacter sp. XJ19-41]